MPSTNTEPQLAGFFLTEAQINNFFLSILGRSKEVRRGWKVGADFLIVGGGDDYSEKREGGPWTW